MSLKRKKPIFYKKVEYDSKEEVEFVMWLEEAQTAGLVKFWMYKPEIWELISRQSYRVVKTHRWHMELAGQCHDRPEKTVNRGKPAPWLPLQPVFLLR